MQESARNLDPRVVEGFGDEWTRFDQSALSAAEKTRIFDEYFGIFPWEALPPRAVGADFGCGSGRWASLAALHVEHLYCIDASAAALAVARRNLEGRGNCEFIEASVDAVDLPDGSLDFGYSLGVLHHLPDTQEGIRSCVRKLKRGAPFLVYLYYRFDQRPLWFRAVWRASDLARRLISRLPHPVRYLASQLAAALVYWPFARLARLLVRMGVRPDGLPLAYYGDKSFFVMRTDALDRFGTRLEHRFTRAEIEVMMRKAGLGAIRFSNHPPFWCAVGIKDEDT